jgi:hypothetical protein
MSDKTKPAELEIVYERTPPEIRHKTTAGLAIVRDENIATQVMRLSALGLSKTAIATFLEMSLDSFNKYYAKDMVEGVHKMSVKLAELAWGVAESGDPKMIQFLCKVLLKWTETSTVEHVGEVRAIVSAKPMTEEEFAERFLQSEKDRED